MNTQSQQQIRSLRRMAAIGFYGSMIVVVLAISAYYYMQQCWDKQIVASQRTHNLFIILSLIATILNWLIYSQLYKSTIKNLSKEMLLEERIEQYYKAVRAFYLATLLIILFISCLVVIGGVNILLLFPLLLWMLLLMHYPNMYRIKVEIALGDEEMNELFGDKYIPQQNNLTQEKEEK